MLVLSRKPGETISVGPDVVITILSSTPSRTKIGVEAPPDVRIQRGELLEKKQLVGIEGTSNQSTRST